MLIRLKKKLESKGRSIIKLFDRTLVLSAYARQVGTDLLVLLSALMQTVVSPSPQSY